MKSDRGKDTDGTGVKGNVTDVPNKNLEVQGPKVN